MKYKSWIISVSLVLVLTLAACSSTVATDPPVAATTFPATDAELNDEPSPTPNPLTLSEPGSYQFGTRMNYKFTDASRADREISLYVWYPAVLQADTEPSIHNLDAEPDMSDAPYPTIVTSVKSGVWLGPHLATHGFVVVGIRGQDARMHWGSWLVDFPLDQAFALEQVATIPLEGLEGMIDADQAGAMGYSFDGYNALALGGARVDPEYYHAQCADAVPGAMAPKQWWIDYICNLEGNLEGGWEEFVNHAGSEITTSMDGLWQPLTNDRIKAVIPMAPEGAWLFGERGLDAVDRPTLIIAGTADAINYYDLEAVYIFEHLGTSEKSMISFVDQAHFMITNEEVIEIMNHFTAAFFGYYLQNKADYKQYFSEGFIAEQEGLAWGVYGGE